MVAHATVSVYRWNNQDPNNKIRIALKTNQPGSRIMAVLDCMKDAFKVKDKVKDKQEFEEFLTNEFPPNQNENELPVQTILSFQKLGRLFRKIMSDNNNFITEEVFERADGTSHRNNLQSCLNESGWSGEKLSVYGDEIISFDVAANHIDCGPGNGNVCFPPIGWVMEFDHDVMKKLGFNQITSFKVTTIGIRHYYYEVTIRYPGRPSITLKFSNKYCSNPMKISNPTKNNSINNKEYSQRQFELLYILHKAGGDPRQMETGSVFYELLTGGQLNNILVYDFLQQHDTTPEFLQHIASQIVVSPLKNNNGLTVDTVVGEIRQDIARDIAIMNSRINTHRQRFFQSSTLTSQEINQSFATTFMSCTSDNTAFYKSVELGCPAVLTPGGRNDDGSKEALCYQPTTDPMIATRNTVEVAFKQIKDNHDNLKDILNKVYRGESKLIAKINGPRRIMIKTLHDFDPSCIYEALYRLNVFDTLTGNILKGIEDFIINFQNTEDPAVSDLMYKSLSIFVYLLKKNFIFPVIFTPQIRPGGRTILGYFIDVDMAIINSVRDNTLELDPTQLSIVDQLFTSVEGQNIHAEYMDVLESIRKNDLGDMFKNQVLVTLDPIFNEGKRQIDQQLNHIRGRMNGGRAYKSKEKQRQRQTIKTTRNKRTQEPVITVKIEEDYFGLSSTEIKILQIAKDFVSEKEVYILDDDNELRKYLTNGLINSFYFSLVCDLRDMVMKRNFNRIVGNLDEYFVYNHDNHDYDVIDRIENLKIFNKENQKSKVTPQYELYEMEPIDNMFLIEISDEIDLLGKNIERSLGNFLSGNVLSGKFSLISGGYSKKKTYKSKKYRKPKRNKTKNRKKKSKSKRKTKK